MKKFIFFTIILSVFFAGCVSTQQPTALNQMQIQIAQLERQLEKKEGEISDLKYQVEGLSSQVEDLEKKGAGEEVSLKTEKNKGSSLSEIAQTDQRIIRVAVAAEDVQSALKNAGFYTGEVDGKVGLKTKKAIEEFQQGHGLKSDGVVGEKTWSQLKEYLN